MTTNGNPADVQFTVTSSAPRIIDPGGQGWPDDPKVSGAEQALFGQLAGVVRLLGQAAVATDEAYRLACKQSHTEVFCSPSPEAEVYDDAIIRVYDLSRLAGETHRAIAERAVALERLFASRHGQPVEEDGSTGQSGHEPDTEPQQT